MGTDNQDENINFQCLKEKNQSKIRIFDDKIEIDVKRHGKLETICYELKETTVEFVKFLRMNNVATSVIKRNGKIYYCVLDNFLKNSKFLYTNLSPYHKCATTSCTCKRLLALPEKDGGCSKVLNNKKGIEDFDWITYGYEVFNLLERQANEHAPVSCFVVIECEHYSHTSKETPEKSEPKKENEVKIPKMSAKEYRLYSLFRQKK